MATVRQCNARLSAAVLIAKAMQRRWTNVKGSSRALNVISTVSHQVLWQCRMRSLRNDCLHFDASLAFSTTRHGPGGLESRHVELAACKTLAQAQFEL